VSDERPHWHGATLGNWVFAVFGYGFGSVALLAGLLALAFGDAMGPMAVATGVFFAGTAIWVLPPARSARPRATPGGLVLRWSRLLTYAPFVSVAGLGAGLAATPERTFLLLRFAGVAVVALAGYAATRADRASVVLAPKGIVLDGPRERTVVPWPAGVVAYDEVYDGYRLRAYRPCVRAGRHSIPVWRLSAGPRQAYDLIRHYAEHPEERAALGQPVA
jgi:hypothetical protein